MVMTVPLSWVKLKRVAGLLLFIPSRREPLTRLLRYQSVGVHVLPPIRNGIVSSRLWYFKQANGLQ